MQTAGHATTIAELHHCIHELREEVRVLKEQLRLALRRQFGSSSEAFCADQLSLLELTDVDVIITDSETPTTPSSRKTRTLRQAVIVSKDNALSWIWMNRQRSVRAVAAACIASAKIAAIRSRSFRPKPK